MYTSLLLVEHCSVLIRGRSNVNPSQVCGPRIDMHLQCRWQGCRPWVASIPKFRTVASKLLLMIYWFVNLTRRRMQHGWKRGHWEENNDTICAGYRKGSRFQMLFLELINSKRLLFFLKQGHHPDPLEFGFASKKLLNVKKVLTAPGPCCADAHDPCVVLIFNPWRVMRISCVQNVVPINLIL